MNFIEIEKILWLCIGAYWLLYTFNVKQSIKIENKYTRIVYMCLWMLAFMLLFTDNISFSFMFQPFLFQQTAFKVAGLILCIAGLSFSVWARIYLGENWSGVITLKKGHELIKTGPYALSRNPIYTGFLVAFAGCAMTAGVVKAYLSLPLIVVGILLKIGKEENFMNEAFGANFTMYKQNVKRLLPFIY